MSSKAVINVPVKNAISMIVGNATIYPTGRIDILTNEDGKALYQMYEEGLSEALIIKAELNPAHPLNAHDPSFKQLVMPHPRTFPFGIEITKDGLKEAWDSIVTPLQESGDTSSVEWRVLIAALRAVYSALPEDE